jgi:hypothetical protein
METEGSVTRSQEHATDADHEWYEVNPQPHTLFLLDPF